jgi:hypothetical protein
VATWGTPPGLSKASPTGTNFTLQQYRHMVTFGFAAANSPSPLNWGCLIVDISDDTTNVGEAFTLTTPVVPGTIQSVSAIQMPREWTTIHFLNEPSGTQYNADAGPSPVNVTGSPWTTITAGSNGMPSILPASTTLVEAQVSPTGGGGPVGGRASSRRGRARRRR